MDNEKLANSAVPLAALRLVEKLSKPTTASFATQQFPGDIGFTVRVSTRTAIQGRGAARRMLDRDIRARRPHVGRILSYDSKMHELFAPDSLIERFRTAVTRRVAAERQIATRFELGEDSEEERYRQMLAAAEKQAAENATAVQADFDDVVAQFQAFEAAERERIAREYSASESRAVNAYDIAMAEIDREYREKDWVVDSLIDEQADSSPQRQLDQLNASEARTREFQTEQLAALRERVEAAAKKWRTELPADPRTYPDMLPATMRADAVDLLFQETVEQTDAELAQLKKLKLAKWTRGPLSVLWFFGVTAAVAVPLGLFIDHEAVGRSADEWWPIVTGFGAFFGAAFTAIVTSTGYSSKRQAWTRTTEAFQEAVHKHQGWCMKADDEYGTKREHLLHEIEERSSLKSGKMTQLATRRAKRENEAGEVRDAVIAEASALRTDEIEHLERRLSEQRASAASVFEQRQGQAERDGLESVAEASGALQRYLDGRGDEFALLQRQMVKSWSVALEDVESELNSRRESVTKATWEQLATADWQPPTTLPNGLALGDLVWQVSDVVNAASARSELASLPDELPIPAVLDFPGNPSVVFRGKGQVARRSAEQAMQSLLLRAFTSIPPSQMRVTLLDPIGLGEPFSPFMHLTDVDERLIAGRIWTEPSQIEAQLADLTEHMENVLQTYLRGDFPTIEAYNKMAGEVAEPYRFLVVNGFPHRFSEQAVRRLLSIASNGPRCGVFLVIYHDSSVAPNSNLSLEDLNASAEVFTWNAEHECYALRADSRDGETGSAMHKRGLEDAIDTEFSESKKSDVDDDERRESPLSLNLRIPDPPGPITFNEVIRNVGNASKDAGRVEVSFGKIAPLGDKRWTFDSRRGLDIPLGRAGATKLQHARFGRGTAQHMLVAGKTGSGKSTFLHALITNAALHYAPNELRFFLIDFKKGVEFKAYAPEENGTKPFLPHADVIAVESEREFGVSALKRLDELLNERGELFRAAGVQDVGQYRDENPTADMPRVMLLIDEFQEFFVVDDALAQQASLLLDRLIRQGRAFGVHCVLGSQTLGGAYSLARSTLGQIGIRVALQCSEADAHLIMAEDNTAARLLARPGEAIYNDAGGLVEGNQPFQVAYLTDDQRTSYLAELTGNAREQELLASQPVVFEGNKPAVLSLDLIDAARTGPPQFATGDAVEIKPSTSISLTRRAAANVLVVGTSHDQTRGLLVAAATQLASRDVDGEAAAGQAEVYVLHTPDTDDGVWKQTFDKLHINATLYTSTDIASLLAELDEVRAAREGTNAGDAAKVLIVDGLQNFRQLRRSEDDYGFGGGASLASPFGKSDAAPPPVDPGKLFTSLLSEGPERGLFTIVSVDGYSSADRALGRKGLRDFGSRVLFRLSANDSSSLIDSPAASKLDALRGLVYEDSTGDSEKFRPFAIPSEEDLDRMVSPREVTKLDTTTDEQSKTSSDAPDGPTGDDDDGPLPDAALDDFLVH